MRPFSLLNTNSIASFNQRKLIICSYPFLHHPLHLFLHHPLLLFFHRPFTVPPSSTFCSFITHSLLSKTHSSPSLTPACPSSLQEKHVKEKQVTHWKTVVKLQEKLKTVLNKVGFPLPLPRVLPDKHSSKWPFFSMPLFVCPSAVFFSVRKNYNPLCCCCFLSSCEP